jgi:hypothetical protein
MFDWDKFYMIYDAKTESYIQKDEQYFIDRVEHLKKLGYLVETAHYLSPYGHSNTFHVLRAIKTKVGKKGNIKEKKNWVRF